jgi:Na+/H+ antiporter NhaB
MVLPGLLAVARDGTTDLRRVGLGTAAEVVFLMWGECQRLAIDRAVEWLAVLADFLRSAPVLCALSPMFDRSLARAK